MADVAVYEKYEKLNDYWICRCPEPRQWPLVHRVPIDCLPLLDGESIEEWRLRRDG